MADDQILARLNALEKEIKQLNRRLTALEFKPPPLPAFEQPFIPPGAPKPVISPEPAPSSTESPSAHAPPPPPVESLLSASSTDSSSAEIPLARPTPRSTPRHCVDIETKIGKNLSSWIGAILLLLGVCFFLKYAWDHQWIHPTPMMRMLAGASAGVIVGIVGEWSFRRNMHALAGACFGAAIAIIMASFFAGAVYFPVGQRPIDIPGAFAAVGVTTLLGIAIALRSSDPAPAVVALIGAYLSPFILNTGSDQSLNFLAYITLITALGWALDVLRWRWIAVRVTACLGAWICYSVWQSNVGLHHHDLAVIFATVLYVIFLTDFFFSAHRLNCRPAEKISAPVHNTLAIFSVISTAFAFSAFYQTLRHQSLVQVGAAVVLMAIWQLVAALFLSTSPLKVVSYLQAAALITLAIPLLLDHFAITLAWALMSLVVCITGRVLNLKWLYLWSISLSVLAVGHLLAVDQFRESLWITWFTLGALPVSAGLLMAWGLAVLAQIIANFYPPELRPNKLHDPIVPQILAIAGTVLFIASKLIHEHPAEWTFAALIWTSLLLILEPLLQLDYAWHIVGLLVAITVKWVIVDSIIPIANSWDIAGGVASIPFLNHSAIAGVVLILLLVFCAIQMRDRAQIALPTMSTWIVIVVFVFASIESCRCVDYLAPRPDAIIKQVALSILWAAIGLAAVSVGFARKITALRYAALILLGITLLKILLIDMADIEAIWRILSFLGVGILLLLVSYIYHKQFANPATE